MRLPLLTVLLLSTTPAMAVDAITYKGTLGGRDIIVELTDPQAGPIAGRYSDMAVGGDIPLHHRDGLTGIALAEEAPCTDETCIRDADGEVSDPPFGLWSLEFSEDGRTVTGTWTAADKPGKSLDIGLTEIGRRALPEGTELTPMGLADSAFVEMIEMPISAATAPYDFAKMDVSLSEGEVQDIEGSSLRFVTDPRSIFAFPRLVALADGSPVDAANRALAARHAAINFAAFSCLNAGYAGFAYNPYSVGPEGGSLGDYDGENIAVSYLSPTVMGWTEAGSTWCGEAHPNNHFNSFYIDVKTGSPLALAAVFKDWIAIGKFDDISDAPIDQQAALAAPEQYYWSAGEAMIDYVLENYSVEETEDAEECGIEGLITTNLGVRFGQGDTAVFSLVDLPHVNFACGGDLVTVPLAEIPELLAPTAADYFPSLAK